MTDSFNPNEEPPGHTPQDPEWAGTFTEEYWQFVRDGRWHMHDVETGALLGILPLPERGVFDD